MARRGEKDQERGEMDGQDNVSPSITVPSNQTPSEASSPPPSGRTKTGSTQPDPGTGYFRHPLIVRLTHWINALCLLVLSISGLQISAGRYWFGLGRWHHYFFAWIFALNGLVYTAYAVRTGHFKNLLPARSYLHMIGKGLGDLLFRRPNGEEGFRQIGLRIANILQKMGYAGVVFGLGPLILLTGLVSSPRGEAFLPALADLFGTRQRAKALHFDITLLLIGYTVVHLVLLLLTGFWNNVRSMLTGWYRIRPSGKDNEK
ncbi:MAG: cytochrome b/b6 domain-containing protein [Nitrospirae bacterium]|nr:cytochrome b/b6 domain-containing protein [Candidatus Manganitrophaceae bacterium]